MLPHLSFFISSGRGLSDGAGSHRAVDEEESVGLLCGTSGRSRADVFLWPAVWRAELLGFFENGLLIVTTMTRTTTHFDKASEIHILEGEPWATSPQCLLVCAAVGKSSSTARTATCPGSKSPPVTLITSHVLQPSRTTKVCMGLILGFSLLITAERQGESVR